MIETQYHVHLNYRKYRFSPEWDFYSITSSQHWREVFEKAVNFTTKTASFKKQCCICEKVHEISVDAIKYFRWQSGELIQLVFPEKTEDERELMISGTCGDCFASISLEEV